MNEEELDESLEKTFKILAVSAKIANEAYRLSAIIVDKHTPYKTMIKEAVLPSARAELVISREESISAIAVTILTISEDVRV